MQIAGMEAFILRWPEPNDFNHERMTVLLRVDTNAGVSGWGEAIAMWPEACRATVAIIEDGFAPLLAGRDPRDVAGLLAGDEGAQLVVRRRRHRRARHLRRRHGALGHRRQGRRSAARSSCSAASVHEALPACASMHVNQPTIEDTVSAVTGLHRRRIPLGEARAGQARRIARRPRPGL